MDFLFGIGLEEKDERKACKNIGFELNDPDLAKDFISKFTDITKLQNWERMSMSTALGSSAVDVAYFSSVFDGRYMYFCPFVSKTALRFDTTQSFTTAAAWERMSLSSAIGTSSVGWNTQLNTFDGRYIYYCPTVLFTFFRFDTTQSFTNSSAWEKMSASTAQGGANALYLYYGATFDGRYVYFSPAIADTFLRFDTTQSFTNSSAWEKISMSTAQDAVVLDSAYRNTFFAGRYVYFSPASSVTFLRFDTTKAFTNSSAWEKINMSTAIGTIIEFPYSLHCFDGRYVYACPITADSFLRFDTTKSFTNSLAWEQMNKSTVIGGSTGSYAFEDFVFDGRYVCFVPRDSATYVRFDTTKSFTNSSAWERMSMSTAQGGSFVAVSYLGAGFDGKYVYFGAGSSDTFLRVLANPSKIGK